MSIPTKQGWEIIESNEEERYCGYVYSFDVPEYESYVADGIVSHNCIYSWRGAIPYAMLEFEDKYNAEVISLGINYRCPASIVSSAVQCIEHNENRFKKELVAARSDEGEITYTEADNTDEEAVIIRERITQQMTDGINPGNIIVLMRTNAQSRALEEEFVASNIPFIVLSAASFYERKEIKDLLSYLRLIADPLDSKAGSRAISRPFRFISTKILDEISHYTRKAGGFLEAATYVVDSGKAGRAGYKISEFIDLVSKYRDGDEPSKILHDIVKETNYIEYLQESEGTDTPETSRALNVGELIASASRFHTCTKFVSYIDKQIQLRRRAKIKKEESRVQIMTIHKSKGTEAPVVYIIGANDGVIPHAMGETEEERRLWYVAMTRAKNNLHVSSIRYMSDGNVAKYFVPSLFAIESGFVSDSELKTHGIIPNSELSLTAPGNPDMVPDPGVTDASSKNL